MRFLLGLVFGMFAIFGLLFAATESGVPLSILDQSQTVSADEAKTNNADLLDANIIVAENTDNEVKNITEAIDAPVVVDDETVEVETDDIIPQNITLFVAETAQNRMSAADIADLPKSVTLGLWPDSPLIASGRPYYLLTAPLDIVDSYGLKEIVNDETGLYKKAFPKSEGVFVRDLVDLTEASEFTRAIFEQMAQNKKSLVIYSGNLDPNLNEIIDETQVDFGRIDFVIEPNHARVGVKAQWDAIVEQAGLGKDLNILLEFEPAGLKSLNSAIMN